MGILIYLIAFILIVGMNMLADETMKVHEEGGNVLLAWSCTIVLLTIHVFLIGQGLLNVFGW